MATTRAIRVLGLGCLLLACAGSSAAAEALPWSFRQPSEPEAPDVARSGWPRSPLDRYVLRGLEEKGLEPAPPADRRTWLRRVTFDLTGLPPAPEETADYLVDESPDACERVTDRLLASPRHGERWGRHWLDVARYSDSNGMDENLAHANAYRYRDYVIAAFNADEPFDRFVLEQIAGDLLEEPGGGEAARDRVIATGFLSIGPKMLAEDDPVKMEMDIVDEQVDTVGRTFLGLTLGCARCHDHKYDPIPAEDYYALAGIFKSTRTMDHFKVVARWHERLLGSREDLARREAAEKAVAAMKAEVDRFAAAARERMLAAARSRAEAYAAAAAELARWDAFIAGLKPAASGGVDRSAGAALLEAEDYTSGNVVRDFTTYGSGIGVIYNRGELPNVAEYRFAVAREGAYQVDLRYAAAEPRPLKLLVNGQLLRADAARRATGSWTPETQTWEPQGIARLAAGENTARLERDGPFPHVDKLLFAPVAGEAEALDGAKGPAELAAERELNAALLAAWRAHLEQEAGPASAPDAAAFAAFLGDSGGPLAAPERAAALLPPAESRELERLKTELESLQKAIPALPEAMAVEEGKPEDLRVHLRGSHLDLGPPAPRRFPSALARAQGPAIDGSRSGRLELARWIASADHPLTARVIANRVWRWHFGAGIVRTPDNFGALGERPTHPELLDWLALRLVADGWSLKRLHRRMVLSATYRMGAAHDARAAELDPENRLLWRWSRRRLEAEAIRDALLECGGGLDFTAGGSLLTTRDREYVATTASTNATRYDSRRRSVYLPVVRSALYDVFQAFDFADPSTSNGDRQTTTVPGQALFLLNGELVEEEAGRLASRLLARADLNDAGRVALAYEIAFARLPSSEERAEALAFLERIRGAMETDAGGSERRARAWAAVARALFTMNELLHVD
ncbi:MAG: DUF1553 domain-containing protein [Planctomycetes bacterium]|nr:DUF1553 domain-containing protein [Planctomycetota bacterium]